MTRSRALTLSAALGVGVLGIAPTAVAGPTAHTTSPAQVRVSGPTPFTAGCNGPTPLVAPFTNAEVEPSVAADPRDPRHLISVYQQDRYPNDGANGALASVSTNGGRTWTVAPLAQQPRFARCSGGNAANGGDFDKASDPWVDISRNGTAYVVAVSFNDADMDTAELVSRSTDGGRSWGTQRSLIRENLPNVVDDRPAVTADAVLPNNAYVVWARQVSAPASAAGGSVYFSRTTDGGLTWSKARSIYDTPRGMETSANQIVELPNGDLVDVFTQLGLNANSQHPRHDAILEIRSTDHGRTWSSPTTVATSFVNGVTDPPTGKPVRDGDHFTHIVADPRPGTSNLYAVWGDARFTGGGTQQIAFAKSTDGGLSWSAPVRVSTGAGAAFVPAVGVNAVGAVGVAYYQMAAGAPSEPTTTRYWITTSADGGRHWASAHPLSRSFDMRTAPFDDGYFLGEYQGFTGAGRKFVATAALPNGRPDDPTDIYAMFYDPSRH